jgi:hypothetical protein
MIMVMMVMITRWSCAQLEKEEREKQNLWSSTQRYKIGFSFGDQGIIEGVITFYNR